MSYLEYMTDIHHLNLYTIETLILSCERFYTENYTQGSNVESICSKSNLVNNKDFFLDWTFYITLAKVL